MVCLRVYLGLASCWFGVYLGLAYGFLGLVRVDVGFCQGLF